jgi:lipid-A-disaccharide synthase
MKPKTFMIVAGETSGDLVATELVNALKEELAGREARPSDDFQPLHASLEPRFFGAGGSAMAAAGVEILFDLTQHAVIGISDVLRKYFTFRHIFRALVAQARRRHPDAIICVDFSGFNRRLALAIRNYTRVRQDWFHNWRPKIVQYVSPQVWASRENRVFEMQRAYDLILSTFPFEREWYARKVPKLRVEFVGNPIVDRHWATMSRWQGPMGVNADGNAPLVLLLPGSRSQELARHIPVMVQALALMRAGLHNLRARMVLPTDALVRQAKTFQLPGNLEVQCGGLACALAEASLALACTGTVTLECACFGVPAVAFYKTSWANYQIGKRIVEVKYLAMPNLLANEQVFPEFIQDEATPEKLSSAGLELLQNRERRAQVQTKLKAVVGSLGPPGAATRAARQIISLMEL